MKLKVWTVAVVALLVAGAACTTQAATDGTGCRLVSFTGTVDEVNDDGSFVIDGQTMMTDGKTDFDPGREAVVEGATVEVDASRRDDGTLVAIEIEVIDDTDDDEDNDGYKRSTASASMAA